MTRILWALALCAALLTIGGMAEARQASSGTAAASRAMAPVDINAASLADLETLPGIGRQTAERIIEYRDKNGGFKKVEELMNVRGIGEKSFLRLKPMVAVTPKPEKAGGLR